MNLLRTTAALAALAVLPFLTGPAAAAGVTIVVNGAPVSFDQPPLERAGRVFVPLRGVFERLGASVVYANGLINATGNGRSVSLHIGSTSATVNGQTQIIDVAPFLVGPRTMVPLRFVSQALGAVVNYDNGTRVITIRGAAAPVNPPPQAAVPNHIRLYGPSPGSRVGPTFTVSGNTLPGSSVRVIAQAAALGAAFVLTTGTFSRTVRADGSGNFDVPVVIVPIPGGHARVIIRSISPRGAIIARQFNYRT